MQNQQNQTHDCHDFEVVNCDGEFHYHFCSECNRDMGVTVCEDN